MARIKESLSMKREMFFRKHPNLRTAGWDERDCKLWSQVRQLPSYGILAGDGNRMVSSQAVIELLKQAAEERFAKEMSRDEKPPGA